jgi:UDP-N-acetylglucosamine:LPS N-acetylglucosamine transferase
MRNSNESPKKIVILTSDAGFGHRSASNAIKAALEELPEEKCQVDIINPLEDKRTPFFLRDSQEDYDRIVREMPKLYQLGYEATDDTVATALIEGGATVLLYEVMWDILKKYKPDAIVTTYPLYQAPLTSIFTIERMSVPLITVVTDLVTVHRFWFHKHTDVFVVPTDSVKQLALDYGVDPQKIRLIGIPVHPNIHKEQRTRQQLREVLGWRTDLPTILAVGSKRVEGLVESLNVVNHFGAPLQLVVVAGKDEELYQKLQQIEWHLPTHIYNYVSDMPMFLRAADVLITKAGGLISTEALAAGLPMILIDLIPGQETGNAEYIVKNGAGDLATTPVELLEVMYHWLSNDQQLLHERANCAAQIGKPLAAHEVATLAWQHAQIGPVKRNPLLVARRPKIIDFLTNHQVHWENKQ